MEISHEIYQQLQKYARSLAAKSDYLPEDLVQDTYLKAIEEQHKYTSGNLRNWLFQLMKNLYIDYTRRKKTHRKFEQEHTRQLHPTQQQPGITELMDALNLTPVERQLFEMRAEGDNMRKIANRTMLPLADVVKIFVKIRNKTLENPKLDFYLKGVIRLRYEKHSRRVKRVREVQNKCLMCGEKVDAGIELCGTSCEIRAQYFERKVMGYMGKKYLFPLKSQVSKKHERLLSRIMKQKKNQLP